MSNEILALNASLATIVIVLCGILYFMWRRVDSLKDKLRTQQKQPPQWTVFRRRLEGLTFQYLPEEHDDAIRSVSIPYASMRDIQAEMRVVNHSGTTMKLEDGKELFLVDKEIVVQVTWQDGSTQSWDRVVLQRGT